MSFADAAPRAAALRPAARLRAVLVLARVSNAPTVVSGAIAGAALAAQGLPDLGRTALTALALVAVYLGGMVLNDLLDVEVDRVERPGRPLPSGAVTVRGAAALVAGLFGGALVLLALVGVRPLASGACLVGLVVLYDAWHKGNPWSPVVMGGCRALVPVTAFLAIDPSPSAEVALAAALLGLWTVAITLLAKREQDGPLASWWPVAALLVAPAVWLPQAAQPWGAAAGVAAIVAVLAMARLAHRGQVREAVGLGIAAMALYDAAVLASVPGAGPGVLVALAAFVLTVVAQRRVPGT